MREIKINQNTFWTIFGTREFQDTRGRVRVQQEQV